MGQYHHGPFNFMIDEDLELLIKEIDEELVPDFDVEKVNQYVYRFLVGDLTYQVEMTESFSILYHPTILNKDKKKIVEIKFKLLNNPKLPKLSDFKNNIQYQMALKKSQIGITGTGNPIKVFKKVIGSIINTIKEISPDYITFVADETNRQSLYEKLIEIVEKYIDTKYIRITTNPLNGEKLGTEEFWMEKKFDEIKEKD